MSARKIKAPLFYRSFAIDSERAKAMTDENRTVELSFSSDIPYRTWNWDIGEYNEILDHKAESVDLSRLNGGGALLLEHDRRNQIGVVESANVDGHKGRATVRFSKSDKGQEIFQDVKDGIRSLVSVGYRVHEMVVEKVESDGLKTMRAIRWEPMEVSIVSIPADTSVGVGRSEKSDANDLTIFEEEKETMKINRDNAPADGGGGTTAAAADGDAKAREAQAKAKNEERRNMYAIARDQKRMDLYETALEKDWDINEFRAQFVKGLGRQEVGTIHRIDDSQRTGRSLGELFSESKQYRAAIEGLGGGNRALIRGISVEIPQLGMGRPFAQQERATLLTTTGVTGYERPPGVVELGQQELMVAALFAQGQTSLPTVRVTQEVTFTNAATAVAEEGQKPEATFDLVETDFGVKKIAVIGRVSDEMFADFPMVRDYVNGRLTYMVGAKEDSELINGAGGSSHTGILATSGIQTENAGASPTPAESIHKAITKVRSVGFFQPDAIVLHPTDWQILRLTRDGNGQYFAGGPFGGAYGNGQFSNVGVLWGLPVVVTTSIAAGTGLVGAFRLGAQLFRRMGITLDTTNSDASDFVYNRICIRVETRAALAVYRPLAFCSVTNIA